MLLHLLARTCEAPLSSNPWDGQSAPSSHTWDFAANWWGQRAIPSCLWGSQLLSGWMSHMQWTETLNNHCLQSISFCLTWRSAIFSPRKPYNALAPVPTIAMFGPKSPDSRRAALKAWVREMCSMDALGQVCFGARWDSKMAATWQAHRADKLRRATCTNPMQHANRHFCKHMLSTQKPLPKPTPAIEYVFASMCSTNTHFPIGFCTPDVCRQCF